MPDNVLKNALARLTSPDVLAEIIAVVIAGLIALAGARLVHAWQRRHAELSNQPGLRARLAEGTVMLTPFLAALGVMLVVRGVLGTMSMHTLVGDTAHVHSLGVDRLRAARLVRLCGSHTRPHRHHPGQDCFQPLGSAARHRR